jgi:hypothetical protein
MATTVVLGNKVNTTQFTGKVTVKNTSTEVVKANENRNGLEIVNVSANSIYLTCGGAASSEEGIFLAASGGSWNGQIGPMVWAGSVFGIASGNSNVTVTEV